MTRPKHFRHTSKTVVANAARKDWCAALDCEIKHWNQIIRAGREYTEKHHLDYEDFSAFCLKSYFQACKSSYSDWCFVCPLVEIDQWCGHGYNDSEPPSRWAAVNNGEREKNDRKWTSAVNNMLKMLQSKRLRKICERKDKGKP